MSLQLIREKCNKNYGLGIKTRQIRSEAKYEPLIIRGIKHWYNFPVGYFTEDQLTFSKRGFASHKWMTSFKRFIRFWFCLHLLVKELIDVTSNSSNSLYFLHTEIQTDPNDGLYFGITLISLIPDADIRRHYIEV